MSGVFCQTSAMMIEASAQFGSESQGIAGRWRSASSASMKPYWELKSQRKFKPTTAGAIIGGISSRVRAARSPRILPLIKTATPMPADNLDRDGRGGEDELIAQRLLEERACERLLVVVEANESADGALRSHRKKLITNE